MAKKFLFFQLNSGLSGDMFSAAILDLNATRKSTFFVDHKKKLDPNAESKSTFFMNYKKKMEQVSREMKPPIRELDIQLKDVQRRGIRALKLEFRFQSNPQHSRDYQSIKNMIGSLSLGQRVKEKALLIFRTIAEAESKIHGKKMEALHFHELGGEDSILDVISAAYLYEAMGSPAILSTSVALASAGEIDFSHGLVSLPAPAVMEILKGKNICLTSETHELTTPTGAAIIRAFDFRTDQGDLPRGVILRTGFGAGSRDLNKRANIARVCLLEE